MKYTPEQKKKIESNLDQIVAYIEDNIQPHIPNDECIKVRFFSENNKHENNLYVSEYGIEGCVGASHVHFDKGERKYYCDCVYKHVEWMLCFVLGWNEAKEKLHKELDKKIRERQHIIDAIEGFEV